MKKVGVFLRFIDESGNISLTNIALMLGLALVVKQGFLSETQISLNDFGLLLATITSYRIKRMKV